MREFAKISIEFWTSPLGKKIRSYEAESKVLVFYLLTCRHTNMLGIYYLPLALASHETGIDLEGVRRGIEVLIKVGFCSYDEDSEYVWVHETAASQLGALNKNDNRVKHVNRVFKDLPNLPFLSVFYEKYYDFLHLVPRDFSTAKASALVTSSEALEIRDRRLDIRNERLEKRKIPIILGGEQSKISEPEIQIGRDEEEEKVNSISVVKKTDPVVFTVPLRQGKTRSITENELADWQKSYPSLDIRQEIRQLVAWNQANPDRQKTERGINRHIHGWLAHTQQNKPQGSCDGFPASLSTWDHNMAVMKAVLEEDDEVE